MELTTLNQYLDTAKQAALKGGERILEVYQHDDFNVELKGDNSPLTKADKQAHEQIQQMLEETGLPVLSEEGADIPYEERKNWEYFWMVDPLDGTKEFIKRNGEFTVNIALIKGQTPIMGVVYAPVLAKLYWALEGQDAYMQTVGGAIEPLPKAREVDLGQKGLRIVASRSHINDKTREFMDSLDSPEVLSMGSSLKFMLLAEGKADIYPRFGPTMEWDTAASHGIMRELGYTVRDEQEQELVYNKEDLLNPFFMVLA